VTTKTNETTIDFRFIRNGLASDLKMMALGWIRSNKEEAIEIISKIKSYELITDSGGTQEQILWAKIEAAHYFSALAKTLELQIAAESGINPSEYWSGQTNSFIPRIPQSTPAPMTTPVHQQSSTTPMESDDDDFDDDEPIIMDID
jgi:hypothetical protein